MEESGGYRSLFFYAVTKTKDFWKAEAVRSRVISSLGKTVRDEIAKE